MTNLTQVAHYARKALKIIAIGLVVLVVGRTLFKVGGRIYRQIKPPPPPTPTVDFGPLPALNFPEERLSISKDKISFKLETIEGGLPSLPSVLKVYLQPRPVANFLAPDRTQQQAKRMGFTGPMEKINENLYRWIYPGLPLLSLEMEVKSGNFHLFYDYLQDPELPNNQNLPNGQQAIQEAKTFLKSLSLLSDDLNEGENESEYLRLEGASLVTANSVSEAQFIRVNLFRTDFDGLPVLPANPQKAPVSFLFSGLRQSKKRILEINYNFSPVTKEIFGTYPLKPVTQAWKEFQEKKGFISNLGQNESGLIIIRRVYLAYFDSPELQPYWQPIYVFEGDRNFKGYVTAIDPQWQE